jgi:hypothetical protein
MKRFYFTAMAILLGCVATAFADSPYEGIDKVKSGEAGYTIGCSIAASMGVAACGELPSGGNLLRPQTQSQTQDDSSNVQRGIPTGEDQITVVPQDQITVTPSPSATLVPTPDPSPSDTPDSSDEPTSSNQDGDDATSAPSPSDESASTDDSDTSPSDGQ